MEGVKDKIKMVDVRQARMLANEVSEKLHRFQMHSGMHDSNCLMKYDDNGPRGVNPPIIPYAPSRRARVYTGTHESGSFNHQSQLVKFRGKYYLGWSNGIADEENTGQRVLISSSEDALSWSNALCLAGTRDSSLSYSCLGICSFEETLYVIARQEDVLRDANVVGMHRVDPMKSRIKVFTSRDGADWRMSFDLIDQPGIFYEAPRVISGGGLMCTATLTKGGPAVLRWKNPDLQEKPEVLFIPEPEGAVFCYGEASWYQRDDGLIVIFWRDENKSCRLWVNFSEDNGRSFSPPVISDIPDSMSRVSAGRLNDKRYFLCNNAFPVLLNRRHLMLFLSDDGLAFNKVYMLMDDPTSQRVTGLLKADGYQYPCCLADGEKLLVSYSVNKEDIECVSLDCSDI